jgi:hypothetical protein
MTFRGVVVKGVVVFDDDRTPIPDGTRVEIVPRAGAASKRRARPRPTGRAGRTRDPLPGFGLWKRRKPIRSAAEFARTLRRRVSSRLSHG